MSSDAGRTDPAELKRRAKEELKASARRLKDELQDQVHELHAELHHEAHGGKGKRRRGGSGRKPRSQEEIVATALWLADEEGFGAVTMRRVAGELGYGTMSLYWYVDSRDELVDLMFDEVIDEQLLPEPVPDDWREGLTAIAQAARDLHRRHPWVAAGRGLRPSTGPKLLHHLEQSLAVTARLAPHPALRANAIRVVDEYVLGFVATEGDEAEGTTSAAGWLTDMLPAIQAATADGDLPHLAAALESPETVDQMLENHFEAGLAVVLDGIQATLDRAEA